MLENDVIKCWKMMSSNIVLLHSNNSCVVLEPAICEDLDLQVAIFRIFVFVTYARVTINVNWLERIGVSCLVICFKDSFLNFCHIHVVWDCT